MPSPHKRFPAITPQIYEAVVEALFPANMRTKLMAALGVGNAMLTFYADPGKLNRPVPHEAALTLADMCAKRATDLAIWERDLRRWAKRAREAETKAEARRSVEAAQRPAARKGKAA